MNTRAQLLNRAANCYLGAELLDEACRCFEQLGDAARAARLHERQARWEQAARRYERARVWADAARCYQRCNLPLEAAECLLKAGERLEAAWVLADQAQRFQRARLVIQGLMTSSLAEALALELVVARCEAGNGKPKRAAVGLRAVVMRLNELGSGPERQRVESWAFAVAERLQRPDLTASLHAAAVVAGTPGAERRWEAWALETLGDATGIPLEHL